MSMLQEHAHCALKTKKMKRRITGAHFAEMSFSEYKFKISKLTVHHSI